MPFKSLWFYLFVTLTTLPALAESKQNTPPAGWKDMASVKSITQAKRIVTKQLASSYDSYKFTLNSKVNQYNLAVNLSDIHISNHSEKQLSSINKFIRREKGLNISDNNLIHLRMANRAMLKAWQNGKPPLFAFSPGGDDKQWTKIEAYDKHGKLHWLNAHIVPEEPIFIVEIDGKMALREGLQIMRGILSASSQNDSSPARSLTLKDQLLSTSVLDYIRLNDDEEPWISGAAEIYAVTTGVMASRDEPVLDIVEMPYIDDDGKDYHPNQILIYWDRYRWKAADVLLMEQDENTNYKTLASRLLNIATNILQSIPNPNTQGYAIIPMITNGILSALPDQWFINNDDYVDTFYTLFEDREYIRYSGARGNATITLTPLKIPESDD